MRNWWWTHLDTDGRINTVAWGLYAAYVITITVLLVLWLVS